MNAPEISTEPTDGMFARLRQNIGLRGAGAILLSFGGAATVGEAVAYASTDVPVAAGSLAVGGATETMTFSLPQAKTLHRHSTMKTQTILDKIHNKLNAGDVEPFGHQVLPTSAYLFPSTGGFRTDCSNPNVPTFRHFKITPEGEAYETCDSFFSPKEKKSTIGEFQKALNHLGHEMETAVGLPSEESVSSIVGTRKKVTAKFRFAKSSGTGASGAATSADNIEKITIDKSGKASVVED